ncbi:MAG: DsbA family oxidoreductase [Verrucomicrobiota bacterium]
MNPIRIDVWSDYVCPFCYLQLPVIQRIEEELGASVEIVWRPFELRPVPTPTLDPKGDYLRDIWKQAVHPMALERSMKLQLPPVQPRSRLAHEAAAYAGDHDRFTQMNLAIFRAFFEKGEDIGQIDILARIATDIGLDGDGLREALKEGSYQESVLQSEQLALRLGITGVPAAFVRQGDWLLEQGFHLEGAQPAEAFLKVIEQVKTDQPIGRGV